MSLFEFISRQAGSPWQMKNKKIRGCCDLPGLLQMYFKASLLRYLFDQSWTPVQGVRDATNGEALNQRSEVISTRLIVSDKQFKKVPSLHLFHSNHRKDFIIYCYSFYFIISLVSAFGFFFVLFYFWRGWIVRSYPRLASRASLSHLPWLAHQVLHPAGPGVSLYRP